MLLRTILLVTSLLLFTLNSCNEYVDVHLSASKGAFYTEDHIYFSNPITGEIISLYTPAYTCSSGEYIEVYASTHTYNRYYPEYCNQAATSITGDLHFLEHTIKAEDKWQVSNAYIYFSNDTFTIEPLPAAADTVLVTDTIDGAIYEDLYRLFPSGTPGGNSIREIHFNNEYGLKKIIMTDGQKWLRIP